MSFWKTHRTLLLLGLILIGGFAIRAAWISDIDPRVYPRSIPAQDPSFIGYDGVRYHAVATNLLYYGTFSHFPGVSDSWRPPGYPWFLYAIYSVFGPDVLMARFFQALLGCAQALIIFSITKRISGSLNAGLLAGALYSFSYDAVLMTAVLYSELFSAIAITSGIALLLHALAESGKIRWLALGAAFAVLGFAALIRPGNVLFLPIPVIYLCLFLNKRELVRAISLSVFCWLVVVLPWVIRNSLLEGRVVAITSHGGLVFFIANHPNSEGSFVPEHTRYTPLQKQQLSQKGVYAAAKDRLHYGFALEFIRDHPGKFIGLIFKKQWLLWTHLENKNFFFALLNGLPVPLIVFNSLAALGIVGMVMAWKQLRSYFLIYGFVLFYCVMISLVFYYHGPRTRVELLPALSIFAAAGVRGFNQLWRRRT